MTWPSKYALVAAIEGVDTLLTESAAAPVLAAWSGTDWSSATSGLFVDLDQKQSAHPWEPFQPGGTLTLITSDDTIGVLMHRTAGGAESELVTTLDQDDTTVTVQATSAFPSSGTINIGTEAISYGSKNATQFLSCTRGKYSPFGCDSSGTGGSSYAHNHRVGHVGYGPAIAPRVTQYPRTWVGRWVGLWVHGYESDGTLQTKANATLVFAGRIVEVRDEPVVGTVILVEHVLTVLKDATIGRDIFSGEVADGVFIPAGASFDMADHNGTSQRSANALDVVTSGASGANQMNEGFYTHAELFTKLNAWWASELAATRLWGTYSIAIATTNATPDSQRTKIYWRIPSAGTTPVLFGFSLPKAISIFFGFNPGGTSDIGGNETVFSPSDSPNVLHHFYKDWVPLRAWVANGLSTAHLRVENPSGAIQDQLALIPEAMRAPASLATGDWGIFMFDDQVLIRGKIVDNANGTYDLRYVEPALNLEAAKGFEALQTYAKRIDDPTPTKIRQVFIFELQTGNFVNRLVYAGGTDGYNHSTYDDLPYGLGLGYPGGLFGEAWETSVANMPGAEKLIAVVIEKPTQISKLIGSDLVLRHVFPIWKNGGLSMATWPTPVASLAVAALTEDNKAEPSGRKAEHRSSTLLSDRWAKNVIKIRYNRDLVKDDQYSGTINIEDRTAVDDVGDRGEPFTIDARNSYSNFAGTGAGIEDIVPNAFIPVVTLFTKPMRTLRRSISRDQWELAPGDIVTVTDKFARDPTTGIRTVSSRPAIIIAISYNPGGARPNARGPEPIVAEVELMFVETNRIYAYSPSALVDINADTGGFTNGYNGSDTLRCVAHAYSESSEPVDAARFAAGDKIRILEIDPSNAASPTTWTRTILSVSSNDITLTSGLSSPAFDGTKEYQITADTYSVIVSSQQDKAFQADDADGLIENAAQAMQFGLVTSTILATDSAHTDLPERHAELAFGDGKPYDVGSIVGFARMVENLIEHKTAHQSAMLSNTAVNNTVYSSGQGWRVVMLAPIYLGASLLSNAVTRFVKVAPWLRSTDGTATQVRVTLMAARLADDTLNDVDRGSPVSEATWSTSSTTWATGTPALLQTAVKVAGGLAWLLVECNFKGETRGLAECTVQERSVF